MPSNSPFTHPQSNTGKEICVPKQRASVPTKWNGISKFQYLLPTVIVNRLTFPVIKGLVEFKGADATYAMVIRPFGSLPEAASFRSV